MNSIKVIGIYKISPSLKSIIQASRYHGYDWLTDVSDNYVDDIPWEDFTDLRLMS